MVVIVVMVVNIVMVINIVMIFELLTTIPMCTKIYLLTDPTTTKFHHIIFIRSLEILSIIHHHISFKHTRLITQ